MPAGTGVSYGHRYVTTAETTLGLVPLGYADGVPRAAVSEEGIREGLVLALARAGAGWRDRLDALAHGWGGDAAISAD